MRVDCILLAAGSGRRFGGKKQFLDIDGKRIIDYSLRVIEKVDLIQRLVVVLPQEELEVEIKVNKQLIRVKGGKERQESVYNGLMALKSSDIVVIHDAARPFATPKMFKDSIDRVKEGCDGSITAYRAVDTIKRVVGDVVIETLDRSQIFIVQTPQTFIYEKLLKAHQYAISKGIFGTDDAYLMEVMGYKVCVNQGSFLNFKITSRDDFQLAQRLVRDGFLP